MKDMGNSGENFLKHAPPGFMVATAHNKRNEFRNRRKKLSGNSRDGRPAKDQTFKPASGIVVVVGAKSPFRSLFSWSRHCYYDGGMSQGIFLPANTTPPPLLFPYAIVKKKFVEIALGPCFPRKDLLLPSHYFFPNNRFCFGWGPARRIVKGAIGDI